MPIQLIAAAGAAFANVGKTAVKAAVSTMKTTAEADAVATKTGGQAATTMAQTATAAEKAVATSGVNAANAAQTLEPHAAQGGKTSTLDQAAMDLKTGKVLPDEMLKADSAMQKADLQTQIGTLKNQYYEELKRLSPFKDTLDIDSIKHDLFKRITPEETMEKRLEFDKLKPDLIRGWEIHNHQPWPRYENDVYSEAGNLIRPKGGLFDAHHIHPLGMGGENVAGNITPMNAVNHYDKQGIHAPGGAYDQLFKLLEA